MLLYVIMEQWQRLKSVADRGLLMPLSAFLGARLLHRLPPVDGIFTVALPLSVHYKDRYRASAQLA